MENNNLLKTPLKSNDYLEFNKRMKLKKDTKWVSYKTFIMTVTGFNYDKGIKNVSPILNTIEYKSEAFVVSASYEDEVYYIDNKELYNNVSKGDKIVVTVKYHYDKDENLIYANIHKVHPYPISND